MKKLVCGVGIYTKGFYKATHFVDGKRKITKEYGMWRSMLERCYPNPNKCRDKTYKGCTVSENFRDFQYFAEWANKQVGSQNYRFQLDKDILSKNNKVYSEATCVFIPQAINLLLVKSNAIRGDLPIGVCWNKQREKFQSNCSDGSGKLVHLGLFKTSEEAFKSYKIYKEALIKTLAEKYKHILDVRVYQELINYEVKITD